MHVITGPRLSATSVPDVDRSSPYRAFAASIGYTVAESVAPVGPFVVSFPWLRSTVENPGSLDATAESSAESHRVVAATAAEKFAGPLHVVEFQQSVVQIVAQIAVFVVESYRCHFSSVVVCFALVALVALVVVCLVLVDLFVGSFQGSHPSADTHFAFAAAVGAAALVGSCYPLPLADDLNSVTSDSPSLKDGLENAQ